VSVSPDGRFLKVKVRGEKRFVWEIPFRDKWRRRSFRTLKRVLEDLGFKDLRREPFERGVELSYEDDGKLCTREVPLRDIVLSACLPPSPMLPKNLLKNECRVRFMYSGKGRFEVFVLIEEDVEEVSLQQIHSTCRRVIEGLVHPMYRVRWPSPKTLTISIGMGEPRAEVASGRVEGGEVKKAEPKIEEKLREVRVPKPPKPPSIPLPAQSRTKTRSQVKPEVKPSPELEEKPVSIEEVKREIADYQPFTFRERAAYERYRQTLERPWVKGREEEIHRLFYSFIKGERRKQDFERFYRELYQLTPEWLTAVQRVKKRKVDR